MAFMKVKNEDIVEASAGILYLLVIDIEDVSLVKIGVTQRKIQDRVVEILTSIFHKYRVFPRTYPKRYSTTSDVYKKEADMHRYFKAVKYTPEHKFNGSDEMFLVDDMEHLLDVYHKVIDGYDLRKDQPYSKGP